MTLQLTRRLTALLLLLFLAAPALAQQRSRPRPTTQMPLEQRIARWEAPERERWQKPDEIVKILEIPRGAVVADIGAGSGYFSRRFAAAVGPQGKVYAVDIDEEILGYLEDRARREGISNIQTIVSRPDDPMLPENSVDLAFFCDTTHHIDNRAALYRNLNKALKDGARVVIIDFPPEAHEKGWCPHKPEELLSRQQAIREAEEAGFKFVAEYPMLERQYFLVFRKVDGQR